MYTVYMHTCPNGKVYIGITNRSPLSRWNNGNGYKNNAHFFNAILKYGWSNIAHEILYDGLSEQEACDAEKRLIENTIVLTRPKGTTILLEENTENSAKNQRKE